MVNKVIFCYICDQEIKKEYAVGKRKVYCFLEYILKHNTNQVGIQVLQAGRLERAFVEEVDLVKCLKDGGN